MMKTQTQKATHTQGEWKHKGATIYVIKEKKEIHIIECIDSANKKASYSEATANARLISAAPDMLDALKELVLDMIDRFEIIEDEDISIMQAKEAIAKAEGK